MDNKVLAVWGNSGAGKSIVSLAIANALTKKDKIVIVVNTNKVTPMLRVYLPFMEEEQDTQHTSVAPLLSGNIGASQVKKALHIHPKNQNLGLMALGSHDDSLVYQENWQMETLRQFTNFLMNLNLVDYLIFDCSTDIFSDNGTLFALKRADSVLRVTSPDNRGYTFVKTQLRIMTGGGFQVDRHISILNNVYSYSPVKELDADWHYDTVLPHSFSVQNKYLAGELIAGLSDEAGYCFENRIKALAERIVADV